MFHLKAWAVIGIAGGLFKQNPPEKFSFTKFPVTLALLVPDHPEDHWLGFPAGSVAKNLPANAEDPGLIPGSGRFSGEGNGNPLQYPLLENHWTVEPGGLQSMESQRGGTRLSN